MKRWLALLGVLLCHGLVLAEPLCSPSPLGKRELFLRGSFNNWVALDEHRFVYVCDRYELLASLKGPQQFKIGDEQWSHDADLGGALDKLVPKGQSIVYAFSGSHKLVLTMNPSAGGSPQLLITPFSGPIPGTDAGPKVDNAVALSVRFDSRQPAHKSPFGAITAGSEVQFALEAKRGISKAVLVIEKRRLEGNQELLEYTELARLPLRKSSGASAERWSASHRFKEAAIYGYYFELDIGGKTYVYQNNEDTIYWTLEKGSMGVGMVDAMPPSSKRIRRYRQTVFAVDFKVPDWARDAVYYYIFPERFRNGDKRNDPKPGRDRYQDKGVEMHSNWLDKPWKPDSGDGSDAVYNNDFFGGDLAGIIEKLDYIKGLGANAIYMTPVFRAASNHKYDTADYKNIDPTFGTHEDFTRLTSEAAKRGLRVIADTSLNHVGSDSIYFDRFANFKTNGAFEGGKVQPDSPYADWFSFDTQQSAPDKQYKGWVGVTDLPEIDKSSKAFRAFAYGDRNSVMKLWLDRGAAGWRMDVAPWVGDDFWREWRAAVKAHKPDAFLIAETWFDASKHLLGDTFDSSMNYIFRNTVLDYAAGGAADKLYANLELLREAYPPQAFYALMNLLSTHDQARALHHFGYHDDGDQDKLSQAKQRLRLALLFQMSFPGGPTIYYGDEVGVGGGDDPYNRATYPWVDEGGKPDLVLLQDFKRITAMRHQHKVLRHGSISAPLHLDQHLIVLARRDRSSWAITAFNNSSQTRDLTLKLPAELAGAAFVDALSGIAFRAHGGVLKLSVPALFGRVLIRP